MGQKCIKFVYVINERLQDIDRPLILKSVVLLRRKIPQVIKRLLID